METMKITDAVTSLISSLADEKVKNTFENVYAYLGWDGKASYVGFGVDSEEGVPLLRPQFFDLKPLVELLAEQIKDPGFDDDESAPMWQDGMKIAEAFRSFADQIEEASRKEEALRKCR